MFFTYQSTHTSYVNSLKQKCNAYIKIQTLNSIQNENILVIFFEGLKGINVNLHFLLGFINMLWQNYPSLLVGRSPQTATNCCKLDKLHNNQVNCRMILISTHNTQIQIILSIRK